MLIHQHAYGPAFAQKDGVAYNPANAHFYKFVPGKITGTNAFAGAAGLSEMGLTGYLTSITSSDENDFVASKIQGSDGTVAKNVWIGASDAETEGDWIWKGGPDNGVQFWKGCNVANGGAPVDGRFSSWASGEPNNWNASLCQVENSPTLGEDCAIINKYSPTSAPPNKAKPVCFYWRDFGYCRFESAARIAPICMYASVQ